MKLQRLLLNPLQQIWDWSYLKLVFRTFKKSNKQIWSSAHFDEVMTGFRIAKGVRRIFWCDT